MTVQDYAEHYIDELKQLEAKLQKIINGESRMDETEFIEFLQNEFEEFKLSLETL